MDASHFCEEVGLSASLGFVQLHRFWLCSRQTRDCVSTQRNSGNTNDLPRFREAGFFAGRTESRAGLSSRNSLTTSYDGADCASGQKTWRVFSPDSPRRAGHVQQIELDSERFHHNDHDWRGFHAFMVFLRAQGPRCRRFRMDFGPRASPVRLSFQKSKQPRDGCGRGCLAARAREIRDG